MPMMMSLVGSLQYFCKGASQLGHIHFNAIQNESKRSKFSLSEDLNLKS